MKIVIPNAIDLVSSTVPENDEAVWVQGQSYGEGAKVLRQHYIYESLQASNTSDPLSSSSGISAAWRKLRASNQWAMFDDAISTQTVAGTGTDDLTVTVRFDYCTCFALLNIVGESITASIKDDGAAEPYWTRTLNLVSDVDNEFDYEFLPISYVDTVVNDFSDAVFDDVPVCINGTLTVTIRKTGGGAAAGHMIVGLSRQPGATLYDPDQGAGGQDIRGQHYRQARRGGQGAAPARQHRRDAYVVHWGQQGQLERRAPVADAVRAHEDV